MPRVRVIHWKAAEAGPLLDALRDAGAKAEYDGCGNTPELWRAMRLNPPDVIVIDLSRLPAQGGLVARWLGGSRVLREVPIVFVGGADDKIAKLKKTMPDAVCVRLAELAKALVEARPSSTPARPIMEAYKARTTAQKLGLDGGGTIGVIDPPRGYLAALGTLPDNAEIVEDPQDVCGVTLWFVHAPEVLLAELGSMSRIAPKTRLWIIWRKGSTNGLTQLSIRDAAREVGLVDYKLCSVSREWSGMLFTRKKA